MSINVDAILKTRAAIVAAPDSHFDMAEFGDDAPSCGTPACLAGFICFANMGEIGLSTSDDANRICGLDLDHIFFCGGMIGASCGDSRHLKQSQFLRLTRADAVAMCDLLIEKGEDATWREVIETRPHTIEPYSHPLPASITDALTIREGPLRPDVEPSDAELLSKLGETQ